MYSIDQFKIAIHDSIDNEVIFLLLLSNKNNKIYAYMN